jgi:hypothetical protein
LGFRRTSLAHAGRIFVGCDHMFPATLGRIVFSRVEPSVKFRQC